MVGEVGFFWNDGNVLGLDRSGGCTTLSATECSLKNGNVHVM